MSTNLPDDGLAQPTDATNGIPAPKIASSAAEIRANQTEFAEETSEKPSYDAASAIARRPSEY